MKHRKAPKEHRKKLRKAFTQSKQIKSLQASKREKKKKALSLPKIQRAPSFIKSFTPRKIEVPGSYESKQRVSIKSKLIFGDFF